MTLAADAQRDRALASLRHHYLQGRLDVDELAVRIDRVMRARTTSELRTALRDLPRLGEVAERARGAAHLVGYLALLAGVWGLASLFLLLVLVGLAIADRSPGEVLAVPLVWLALTCIAVRLGARRLRRS